MVLPQHCIEKDNYTEEEYLRWEKDAAYKSEYVRGDIRAMSGGTVDHNTLSVSVGAELRSALRGRGCRVMSSDMKIHTPRGTFRYPDVTVTCGPPQYHGRSQAVITNPLVVVEVLSDSTAATDQVEKLREYQMLDSLQHYRFVSQQEPRIEVYTRMDGGHWDYVSVESLDRVLPLSALSISLTLADIYEGIEFGSDEEQWA